MEAFGSAVSCSEEVITVGAPAFDNNAGKVYVYDAFTFDLISSFGVDETNARFGFTVEVLYEQNFIGAPGYADDTGAVYSFNNAGVENYHVVGQFPGDNFGYSMAGTDLFTNIGGTEQGRVIIGAPFSNKYGVESGDAIVFDATIDGELGNPREVNPGETVTDGSCFGYSTAFLGTALFVAAPQINNDNMPAEILVVRTNLEVVPFPHPSGGTIGDEFGYDFSISGGIGIAGAPGAFDDNGVAYYIRVQDYLEENPINE